MSKIAGVIIVLLFVLTIYKSFNEKYQLKRRGVYVVGKLRLVESGVKGSTSYTFDYKVDGKNYVYQFSGYPPSNVIRDSAIFLNILLSNPTICRQVLNKQVPKCLIRNSTVLDSLPELSVCD
jgi:hypothetical protein